MRRLRGNDLKSIQLAKNKELLQKYGRDDAWFESVNECDIRPALIIGDSEVRGEVLRIITEYLRAKFIRAANPDSDDEATDNKKKKKPAKPVPHPQSAVGMKVVGRAYHSLVTLGFEAFQMELGEIDEDDTTEYDVLYDGAMLSDTCVDAVDRAVLDVPSENVKPVSSAFGDILVYSDQGKRQTMEDKHVCISDLNSMFSLKKEQPSQAFFAIYDGHGGTEAADYARNHLHVNLVNHPDFESDIIKALEESFKKTDENFLKVAEKENNLSGCTCIVTFVRGEYMYTAWLGDSQAMLCRNGSEVQNICSPHKPDREDEKKRIEDAGGVVVWYGAWRVNGVLSVARAIGDRQLKKYVISECDTTTTQIQGSENFLCLACDGLWDVMDGKSVIQFVKEHMKQGKSSNDVAKALVKHALHLGSGDNISTIIVYFDGIHKLTESGSEDEAAGGDNTSTQEPVQQ